MDEPANRLDLNLVRVFVAIYETRSVTHAAERLDLTQPTVSHSLARLRSAYDDRLFVRGTRGLSATPLAEQLFPRLSESLATIENTLNQKQPFDAARSNRRFRISMSDIGALYFVPQLLQHVQVAAPHIQIDVVQHSDSLEEDLSSGRLDIAVGNLPGLAAETRSALLFSETYVCLMSADHPAIESTMTLQEFLAARHVMVTSPSSGHALVDGVLSQRGITRNVVARVPQFTVLPQLLANSDLLVVLPSRVANLYTAQGRLKSLPLPLDVPGFDVRLHWHARQEGIGAHQWLRGELKALLTGL